MIWHKTFQNISNYNILTIIFMLNTFLKKSKTQIKSNTFFDLCSFDHISINNITLIQHSQFIANFTSRFHSLDDFKMFFRICITVPGLVSQKLSCLILCSLIDVSLVHSALWCDVWLVAICETLGQASS